MGVEPTHPPWQGGRQPLHHGRINSSEHPAGLAPATPSWEGGMLLLHHGRVFSGSGGGRTHIALFKRQVPSQSRPHFQKQAEEEQRQNRYQVDDADAVGNDGNVKNEEQEMELKHFTLHMKKLS